MHLSCPLLCFGFVCADGMLAWCVSVVASFCPVLSLASEGKVGECGLVFVVLLHLRCCLVWLLGCGVWLSGCCAGCLLCWCCCRAESVICCISSALRISWVVMVVQCALSMWVMFVSLFFVLLLLLMDSACCSFLSLEDLCV